MKSRTAFVIVTLGLVATMTPLITQEAGATSGQKTLAATVGVYVFPAEGQDAATQSTDEAACYSFAVDNTKTDPFDLAEQAQQQQAQADSAKQQAQKATAEQVEGFKKAFSACLEAKDYVAKI